MQDFPRSTPSSRRSSTISPAINASQCSFADTAVQSPYDSCATFIRNQSSSTLAVNVYVPSKTSSLNFSESSTHTNEQIAVFGQSDQEKQQGRTPDRLDRPYRPTPQSFPSEDSGTPSEKMDTNKGILAVIHRDVSAIVTICPRRKCNEHRLTNNIRSSRPRHQILMGCYCVPPCKHNLPTNV